MDTLRIRLFGRLELVLGDRALPAFPTRTAKSLFCFLVVNRRRMFPRSVLLGHFWDELDESSARRNLRTALWRMRRVIEPPGVPAGSFLRVEDDCIGFAPRADCWIDAEEFERGVTDIARRVARGEEPGADGLESVLAHYRGDLLDDLYDDWCTFERERFRLSFLTTLERLAVHHAEREQWHDALASGRTLLHHDPLREHVHRLVMRCHWRAGNRPAALLQYESCARLLHAELGIAPMPETSALRDALLRAEPLRDAADAEASRHSPARPRRWAAGASVIRDLETAAAHLEHARARVFHELRDDPPLRPS